MDTFRSAGAEVYTVTSDGLLKYQKLLDCNSVLDVRLIKVKEIWYILLADWSD